MKLTVTSIIKQLKVIGWKQSKYGWRLPKHKEFKDKYITFREACSLEGFEFDETLF